MCCLTSPLTFKNAGRRFHLSLAVLIGSVKLFPA
jgi:hypothetical protein